MESLEIKSKSNTKLKSILWGIIFILFGLAFDTSMIALIVTEGFSVIWVFGLLLSVIFFFAGFYSINMRKYPLELLADDKGIHYYEHDSRFGLGKHEVVIPWETVTAITQYVYDDLDPEDCEDAIVIQLLGDTTNPQIFWLNDAEIDTDNIDDVLSKLNEMQNFYGKLGD